MKLILMLAALMLPGLAFAQISVFPPPTGLQLSTNGAKPYSSTNSPNWTITSWSSPDPLPAFTGNTASNKGGWVTFRTDKRIAFKANGRLLPCMKLQNGTQQLTEYDLMADPPIATSRPAISTLHHAVLSGNVYFNPSGPFDAVCTINMLAFADSLILKDTVNGQVLFYQLKLGGAGVHSGVLTVSTTAAADWFENGINQQSGADAQFGYDDSITSHGGKLVAADSSANYSVDVLPTLLALIAAGPTNPQEPMDHNPADWVIEEEYVSTGVWGHVASQMGWGDLSLVEN